MAVCLVMADWHQTLEDLLKREKALRQAEEINAFDSEAVLKDVLSLLQSQNAWDELIDMLQQLAKRRRQPKQAIQGMVKLAMSFLDQLAPEHTLLFTIRTVCEGKIFLEVEFARVTMRLAKIREEQGRIEEASNLLQEVQVETYGSMEKEEKLNFLLEQMRVLLLQKDFIRFQIISNKVSKKVLDDTSFALQKVTFLRFMITYYDHEKNYFEAAKCYQTIYETILKHQLMDDPQQALERMITYLLLVEHSAEQVDLMIRIKEKENKNAVVKAVLGILLSSEIGRVPVELKEQLQDEEKWKTLVRRINQHNVRVVQKYYSRISLRRLSELLELTLEATEEELRDMVSYMGFKAKINRPEGFVYFPKGTETAGLLNNWGANIFSLLNRLEEISHLIQREASVSG